MTKVFKKNPKRTYFGDILGPFYPNLGKNEFSWKKITVSFQKFQLSIIVPKIRKNYWAISEENTKLTDRQTNDGDFWGCLFSTYTKLFKT